MRALKSFGLFWYDFVIGDDPLVALGVVLGLAATATLAHETKAAAWWIMPVVVALLLAGTLARAVRTKG